MQTLIDTHCHLDFDHFDEDRDRVIERAIKAGVQRIIVPAIDLSSCRKVLALAEQYECVFAAVGVHPNSSAEWEDNWTIALRAMASHPKVLAIGEIGLDYYREWSPHPVQRRAFAAQLALADEVGLPVIIHNRQSDIDVVRLLADSNIATNKNCGVLHSFSGSWEFASTVLEMGFYLGFTGPITYKKADELRDVAYRIPIDRMLIETDAPFLAPQQHRGKRNEPAFVRQVATKIAELRALSVDEIAEQTTANAVSLFGNRLSLI